MNMQRKTSIGVDLGTFHTVAVHARGDHLTFSQRSIPSIAVVIQDTPIVGFEAQRLAGSSKKLIVAPKLKLHQKSEAIDLVRQILRKLVEESIINLGLRDDSVILTVPPAWNLDDCLSIKHAIEALGIYVRFLHEPVALLVAAYYLSRQTSGSNLLSGLLSTSEAVLVCDWGAGTVDMALVELSHREGGAVDFAVLGERTEIGDGGTDIARDIIRVTSEIKDISELDFRAYQLQEAWQGNYLPGFNLKLFDRETLNRRKVAAERIATTVAELLKQCGIEQPEKVFVLLYGGPLESDDLSAALIARVEERPGIPTNRFFSLNTAYLTRHSEINDARRDTLVAAGAALYGTCGEAIPEFEYEIRLRDSFGQSGPSVKLIRDANLKGIQVVTPPFTGVDYFVDVVQVYKIHGQQRMTSITGELKLHIRKGAVVIYRIAEAGVGFARIQACEALDLPSPEPFADSRIAELILPEKATRFVLSL